MTKVKKNQNGAGIQDTKTRILDKASQVFYKYGYRATGVEAIARAAGITKATLYHYFRNKDELIEESLKFLSEFHRVSYVKAWNRKGLHPQERLTVLFDEMHDFFKKPDCYGCPFINAAGEYTDRDSPIRRICENHYAFLTSNLEQFARDAQLAKPRIVAEQITGCIAGAYSAWFVAGFKDAANQGKKTAELIIAEHTSS